MLFFLVFVPLKDFVNFYNFSFFVFLVAICLSSFLNAILFYQ